MPQALSLETPETLTMGELRQRLLGYDFSKYWGRYYLRVRGLGDVFVNGNVIKRFKGIDSVLKAPSDWIAAIRPWRGGYWLYRIASPAYVDVPGTVVLQAIKNVMPGVKVFLVGWWFMSRVGEAEVKHMGLSH